SSGRHTLSLHDALPISTVTKELMIAHQQLGMSLEDLTTVLVSGFKSAFMPFREKQDMLRAVNAEIAEVLARFGIDHQPAHPAVRSEEHTSELQSREKLV